MDSAAAARGSRARRSKSERALLGAAAKGIIADSARGYKKTDWPVRASLRTTISVRAAGALFFRCARINPLFHSFQLFGTEHAGVAARFLRLDHQAVGGVAREDERGLDGVGIAVQGYPT